MSLFYLIAALVVCITIHEASHAYVAYKLGDPTAKRDGRVSLNPLRHLDPLGTLAVFIFHIGWGKPVVINDRNFKYPVRDSALTALAGPISNLLTAFLIAIPLKHLDFSGVLVYLGFLLQSIFSLSIVLAVFNLIPLPPFDGSKILGLFIPSKYQHKYDFFMQRAMGYVVLVLLFDIYLLESLVSFSFVKVFIGISYDLISGFILSNT